MPSELERFRSPREHVRQAMLEVHIALSLFAGSKVPIEPEHAAHLARILREAINSFDEEAA
jgi:signal transduction histidine kinase